jgi:hypothetical protein
MQHVKVLGGEDAQGQGLPMAQTPGQEGKPYIKKGRGAIFTLGVLGPRIWQGTKLDQDQTQMETDGGSLKHQHNSHTWQGAGARRSTSRP